MDIASIGALNSDCSNSNSDCSAEKLLTISLLDMNVSVQFSSQEMQDWCCNVEQQASLSSQLQASASAKLHQRGSGNDGGNGALLDKRAIDSIAALLHLFIHTRLYTMPFAMAAIQVHSQIPIGAGLGSSGALSVAAAAAFLKMANELATAVPPCLAAVQPYDVAVDKLAFSTEKLFHGNPSGIDNTISLNGGLIKYQAGTFEPLKAHARMLEPIQFVLVNTNIARDTKALVGRVRILKDQEEEKVLGILNDIGGIAESFSASTEWPHAQLALWMQTNHQLLVNLKVSHPTIEEFVRVAGSFGLAAKLTGAGGGGCILAMWQEPCIDADETLSKLQAALLQDEKTCDYTYSFYTLALGSAGLMVDVEHAI